MWKWFGVDEIYKWAIRKKNGVSPDTARALQWLVDFGEHGKEMPEATLRRWKEVGRFKHGKIVLTDDEIKGDAISWVLLGLIYEGRVEMV